MNTMASNHSAHRTSTWMSLDSYSRQRHQRWSQKICQESERVREEPTVTSPHGLRRFGSYSKVEEYLEDQQRRSQNAIPNQVHVSPGRGNPSQRSNSFASYIDDDEDLSRMPSFHHDVGLSSTHEQRVPYQVSRTKDQCIPVPRALDKPFLKRIASQRRMASISSHMASRMSSHHSSSTAATFFDESLSSHSPQPTGTQVHPSASSACRRGSLPARSKSAPASRSFAAVVEVFPGLSAPLRGSDETMMALARGYHTALICFGCTAQIHCIADAQFTICPICRVISPVSYDSFRGEPMTADMRWGLGLGLTQASVRRIQAEWREPSPGF